MTENIPNTRIALSFDSKLAEMEFFLDMIEKEWTETVREHEEFGQIQDGEHQNRINYFFGAFSNAFQSVKDSLNSITSAAPWNKFHSVKYFSFVKNSRNAITHDGSQLINIYQSGKFYLSHAGGTLKRVDNHGNEVEIDCPSEDVVTICSQFYAHLLVKVREIVSENLSDFDVAPSSISAVAKDAITESSVIPDFVRLFLKENPELLDSTAVKLVESSESKMLDRIDERIARHPHAST